MNIPFSKVSIGEEEIGAVNRVLRSGWLAAGPETEAFEKEFAEYVGVKYAIFTNSCTSALKMAYKYFKEEQGNRFVYYPLNTFCATYSAAEEMGLTAYGEDANSPIFNPSKRLNVSMTKYFNDEKGFYDRCPTSIKVNVHYGGIKDNDFCDIEDSAHRIEPNDPLIGKIRCYSFYATKNMTTGSGGMFVTNDKEIYEKARLYWKDGLSSSTHDRQTGKSWDYKVETMAGGYDGNDIAASIGRIQLKKLPYFIKKRNRIVNAYNKAFNQEWTGNHLYPYFLKTEKEVAPLIEFMKSKGIACGYHYPKTGWLGVSLPLYPLLTDKEVEYIIEKVGEYAGLRA